MTQAPDTTSSADLRERALRQLKKKRDFYGHVLVYVLVNTTLVVVWALTSHGFFWPIFPMTRSSASSRKIRQASRLSFPATRRT